jgi:hypothetical protein
LSVLACWREAGWLALLGQDEFVVSGNPEAINLAPKFQFDLPTGAEQLQDRDGPLITGGRTCQLWRVEIHMRMIIIRIYKNKR